MSLANDYISSVHEIIVKIYEDVYKENDKVRALLKDEQSYDGDLLKLASLGKMLTEMVQGIAIEYSEPKNLLSGLDSVDVDADVKRYLKGNIA